MFHTFFISLKIRGQIFGGWCVRFALLINSKVMIKYVPMHIDTFMTLHFTTRNQTVSI